MDIKNEVLSQLDGFISTGQQLVASFSLTKRGTSESSEPEERLRAFITGSLAAIRRIAGESSEYYTVISREELNTPLTHAGYSGSSFIPSVLGSVQALREDVANGYLTSLESRLRANVHDDLLVQANDLLKAQHYVAAIVIGGGVLENHLF